MVQFECPRHLIPSISSNSGVELDDAPFLHNGVHWEKFISMTIAYRTTRFPDVVPCSNSTLWTPSLKWISQTATKSPVPTSSIAICGMEGECQEAGSGDDAERALGRRMFSR